MTSYAEVRCGPADFSFKMDGGASSLRSKSGRFWHGSRARSGIATPQCVVFRTRCGLSRRARKRMYLSRACTYAVVSCCARAAIRRNREDLARAPPIEGHDNARVLTHSHNLIAASSAFGKKVPFLILLSSQEGPRQGFPTRAKFARPGWRQRKAVRTLSTQLDLGCSRGRVLAFLALGQLSEPPVAQSCSPRLRCLAWRGSFRSGRAAPIEAGRAAIG